MTTKRLLILFAVFAGGMSLIFLLPKIPNTQPLGIEMNLPPLVGGWYGTDADVTEKERSILGADTEFSRKTYRDDQGNEILVSIVLGGEDMNTSIHRPERCLPAQGWTIVDSRRVAIPLNDAARDVLNVTRLHNMRPVQDKEGRRFNFYNLNYYWFVGCTDTTASHFTRTWFDLRDRLLRGYNQRWAYITVAVMLKNEKTADVDIDQLIKAFIRELVPKVHKSGLKYG